MNVWKCTFLIAVVMGAEAYAAPSWAESEREASTGMLLPAQTRQEIPASVQVEKRLVDESPVDIAPEPVPPAAPPEITRSSGSKTATDKIVEKFMLLDVDGTDGVSMDEYITLVQQRVMARYAAMDADADGEVTEDEYRVFWKSRMAKWYRLKR